MVWLLRGSNSAIKINFTFYAKHAMSEIILKDHSVALESLSKDLSKLSLMREEYHDTTEKLIYANLKEEAILIKAIENQMQNLIQRAKNWPKSVMTRYPFPSTVSVTTIIHCRKCLAKVSISRSTQTLPSFIQVNKRSNPKIGTSPKPLRGILRNSINNNSSKVDSNKDKQGGKNVIISIKNKKEPLMAWSAMEWNGKNEIEEINQKIKGLNERIDKFSTYTKERENRPIIFNNSRKSSTSSMASTMEQKLNQLEEDILYLDSSL